MKIKKFIIWLFFILWVTIWGVRATSAQNQVPLPSDFKKNFFSESERKANEKVTMDFDNVDIRLVIKFMSELTGKNFILDDRVKGKVTVISPTEIKVEDAYAIFESILEVNGFSTVPSGDIVKIVPESMAASKSLETIRGDSPKLKKNPDDAMVTQIITLQYAEPEKVKSLLQPLISKESKLLSYLPTNMLILTERVSNINRLMDIIKEIDVESENMVTEIIHIQHAKTEVLARHLQTLFGEKTNYVQKGKKMKTVQASRLKIIPDERTGNIIIMAVQEQLEEILDVIQKLDIPAPRERDEIQVYFLKNSKAEDMSKILAQIMSKTLIKKDKEGKPETPPLVVADKATNSLIITASPEEYQVVERVLQKLDIMRPQVLVEALIAEVSYEKSRELGVEWRAMRDPSEKGGMIPFGGTNFGDLQAAQQSLTPPLGMFIGLTKGFIEIGNLSFPNLAALIAAYQTDSDVNILSTPHILTTDNEEAEIIVGEEVPLPTRDIINNNISYSTNYKNVGLTLRLTPHINQDGYIKMEIYQEIKKVVSYEETPAGRLPKSATRQAKTTVMLKDGETAVLGGLIRDDNFESTQRVPCVGSVPLISWFFKSGTRQGQKTNLQIFITPHIIEKPEDISIFTSNMKNKLRKEEQGKEKPKEKKSKEIKPGSVTEPNSGTKTKPVIKPDSLTETESVTGTGHEGKIEKEKLDTQVKEEIEKEKESEINPVTENNPVTKTNSEGEKVK